MKKNGQKSTSTTRVETVDANRIELDTKQMAIVESLKRGDLTGEQAIAKLIEDIAKKRCHHLTEREQEEVRRALSQTLRTDPLFSKKIKELSVTD